MTGNALIGRSIAGLLFIVTLLLIGILILESREPRRIGIAIGATIVGCICLAILLLTH